MTKGACSLMALLRFPSTSHQFSIRQQFFFSPLPYKPSPNLISLSTSPIPLSLNTQIPKFHLFTLSSATQAEAPTTIDTDTPQPRQQEEEYSKTRLLAQNVPWSLTADDLRPLFEKYGTIVDIEMVMHNKTRNRGLAFVTMSSEEEAQAAFKNLESYEIEGRNLRLAWAKPRKEMPPPPPRKPSPIHNLYVANLPFDAKSEDLKEFFISENAKAVSAEVILNDNPKQSAGFGFVSFNTKEEADAARTAFQGKVFMGRTIRVEESKKFLRPATKAAIESGEGSLASDPKADEPVKMDDS